MDLRHDVLVHGVYIVTAAHEGARGGLAVAWATQVGSDLACVCVGQQSATRPLILVAGAFGLCVLRSDQVEVACAFGLRSSRNADKFADVRWHTAETGSPLLDDCAYALDCRIVAVHDVGTEKLIIGRILAIEQRSATCEPLVYRTIDYRGAAGRMTAVTDTHSRAKRFDRRAFVSFVAAVSGLSLPVTGYMNHVLAFSGLTAERHFRMAAHNAFGVLFAVFAIWHVVLYRRALGGYLRNVARELSRVRWEASLAPAVVAIAVLFSLHGYHVDPRLSHPSDTERTRPHAERIR